MSNLIVNLVLEIFYEVSWILANVNVYRKEETVELSKVFKHSTVNFELISWRY